MGERDVLLDRAAGVRPTAIFCFNDQVAMGVYQAAEALGLEVPRDCSIVGVGDLEIVAAALDPGDDPALQSLHDEGVRSLEHFDAVRRVLATATALMVS